jgi:hypothetical protein
MATSSGLHSGSTLMTRHSRGDVIAHVLREQGTHGTVDDAARQDRVFGGSAFSLIESARELPDRISFFGIFHAQREEIHALTGSGGLRRGAEHRRFAIVHECTAVGLFPDSADVYGQRTACKFHCIRFVHVFFSLLLRLVCVRAPVPGAFVHKTLSLKQKDGISRKTGLRPSLSVLCITCGCRASRSVHDTFQYRSS